MPVIKNLWVLVYKHLASISWPAVIGITVFHFLGTYLGLYLLNEKHIVDGFVNTFYYWVVTASTVGYGDYSPETVYGKLFVSIFVIFGGIAIFTMVLGKGVSSIQEMVKRKMKGQGDFSSLKNHLVIIGWQGLASQRMIQQILSDMNGFKDIVLVTKKDMENPMPDSIKFVRGESLTSDDVLMRAGISHASRVIIYAESDDQALAAGMAAYAYTKSTDDRTEHIVAYFQKDSAANIFKRNCPTAEVYVSNSVDMMVRACSDPGSTRVIGKLLNSMDGPTQFSMTIPDGVKTSYGNISMNMREKHNATLLGVAKSISGDDIICNAPNDLEVKGGNIIYYMADNRMHHNDVFRND